MGALVLVVACTIPAPHHLSIRLVPWLMLVGVAVLFVVIQFLHDHGLVPILSAAAGSGEGFRGLLLVPVLLLSSIGALWLVHR